MFTLPELPYHIAALKPYIDGKTMEIHHGKHHAAYVTNLNVALEKYPELQEKSIEDLLSDLSAIPEDIRTAVQNNGGGHANHSLFWEIMSPEGGGDPIDGVGEAMKQTFESFEAFKKMFSDAALKQFGSGWAWLVINKGALEVMSTPNQDSPLSQGKIPILGLDVWEHAYYLNYQNRRAEYIEAWWNIVNWQEVARRYSLNA